MPEHRPTRPTPSESGPRRRPHDLGPERDRHDGQPGRGVTRAETDSDPGGMSPEQRRGMMGKHHAQTLWVWWTVVLLGAWTAVAPLSFGYAVGTVAPAGGREVWLDLPTRIAAMSISDLVAGLLLIAFGWRALTPGRPLSVWACCAVGVWLTFAPLIFWAPTAAAYYNDTLVGALVIALTILIPGMPGMMMIMQPGPETPPGWSYNPSSWPQRAIMIGLGFAGWLVSRHLAAYQFGYIDGIWDPFFGDGSRRVLTSSVSEMAPISDAGLGAAAYTFEFLMGWMGGTARWRTMPWMVAFFGVLVIPLGLTHVLLVGSQPVAVGEWCTLCLLAAVIMLPMIPLEVDEVAAMFQFLIAARRKGRPLWQAFWFGGTMDGGGPDDRSPELMSLPARPGAVAAASLWGMTFPWTLVLSAALGVWLMAAPGVLGHDGRAADVEHLAGVAVLTTAVVAMGEPVRTLRLLNVLFGALLAGLPWFVGGADLGGRLLDTLAGLAVLALAIPRGPLRERFGPWDRWIA